MHGYRNSYREKKSFLKKVIDTDVVPYKVQTERDRATNRFAAVSMDNEDASALTFKPDLDSLRPRG